jgi:hypothetical protein
VPDAPGSSDEARPRAVVIGRATTRGQALPLGVDDPVIAARAVRRALADARRPAADVSSLVVASTEPIPDHVLAAFARRALGPHASSVRVTGVVAREADGADLVVRAIDAATAGGSPRAGVLIAVGLGADGTTEARCLG